MMIEQNLGGRELFISTLAETINNRSDGVLTESTVEGPFHMVTPPDRVLGATIAGDVKVGRTSGRRLAAPPVAGCRGCLRPG